MNKTKLNKKQIEFKIFCINNGVSLEKYCLTNNQIDILIHSIAQDHYSDELFNMIMSRNYNYEQLEQIYFGFAFALPLDKIKLYANIEYGHILMSIIRSDLHFTEKCKKYGLFFNWNPCKYYYDFIYIEKQAFSDLPDLELHCTLQFTVPQQVEILTGLTLGLTPEQVLEYADNKYDCSEMSILKTRLLTEKLSK